MGYNGAPPYQKWMEDRLSDMRRKAKGLADEISARIESQSGGNVTVNPGILELMAYNYFIEEFILGYREGFATSSGGSPELYVAKRNLLGREQKRALIDLAVEIDAGLAVNELIEGKK